jgi:hypothetical protein
METQIKDIVNNPVMNIDEKIKLLQQIINSDKSLNLIKFDENEELTKGPGSLWKAEVQWWCNVSQVKFTRWVYHFYPQEDGSRLLSSEFIEYYPNGTKKYYAKYISGKLVGSTFNYYPNGKVMTECYYGNDDGLLKYETHWECNETTSGEGFKTLRIKTCNNPEDTGFIYKYKEGKIVSKLKLSRGVKHGKSYKYYSDKIIKVKGAYKNGKKNGVWQKFFPNSRPWYFKLWDTGVLKQELIWNFDGYLISMKYPERVCNFNEIGVITKSKSRLPNMNWHVTEYNPITPKQHFETDNNGDLIKSLPIITGRKKKWDNKVNKYLQYGINDICLEWRGGNEELFELAKEHFNEYNVYMIAGGELWVQVPIKK